MKRQKDGKTLSKIYKILKVVRDIIEIILTSSLFPIKWFMDKIEDKWGRIDVALSLIFAVGGLWAISDIKEPTPPYVIVIFILGLVSVILASTILLIWIKKMDIN